MNNLMIFEGHDVEVFELNGRVLFNSKHVGKSLELLSSADIAYFAKGWEEARGCKIENTCAVEYGITVIEDYE